MTISQTILISLVMISAAWAQNDGAPFTVNVSSGDFDVLVVESARLDARQSVTLASELPSNQAKIVWLVDEGKFVEAGELIAKFDRTPFEEELAKLRRDSEDARAAMAQAESELQIQIRNHKETLEQLEHKLKLARLKKTNFEKADRPLRLSQAKVEVQTARIAFEQAAQERVAQQQMRDEGFGNENMLKEAVAVENERESALELAEQNFQLLRDVLLPSEQQQAQLEIAGSARELESSRQMNLHAMAKQNSALLRLGNQVAALEESVKQAEALLEKTELHAAVSGFVVYKRISVMNENRKVQIGDSVWNRHGFIVIPDMSAMIGEVEIRERDIGKIEAGQPVTLRPEAYPGLVLSGRVESVGTLASDGNREEESLFNVRLTLDNVDPRLRPGMRAQASILTQRYADVLRVPIEAVFFEGGQAVCFVWDDDEPRRRDVALGESDGQFVIVERGLTAGEAVMLTYPRQAQSE